MFNFLMKVVDILIDIFIMIRGYFGIMVKCNIGVLYEKIEFYYEF